MAMTEFLMKTDIAAVTPQSLEFNFDEIKAWLSENLATDTNIVIREEDIPDAKARRAQINKVGKAINDAKIATKKQYLAPYEKFEAQCKELVGMCGAASDNLGAQLAKFDAIRAQKKVDALHEYFDEHIGDVAEYVTFNDIFNEKWKNATYPEANAMSDIDTAIQKATTDIHAILAYGSEYEIPLLDFYKQTHDLAQTLLKKDALEKAKREKEEREKRAAVERELAERAAKREAESMQTAIDVEYTPVQEAPPQPIVDEKIQIDFRVWATKSQLAELKQFFMSRGIKYGRVQ